MVSIPATVFTVLVFGIFHFGLGTYMLIRAVPAYIHDRDGGLLFLLIIGLVFVAIGAVAFWRVVRARRAGLGWQDDV